MVAAGGAPTDAPRPRAAPARRSCGSRGGSRRPSRRAGWTDWLDRRPWSAAARGRLGELRRSALRPSRPTALLQAHHSRRPGDVPGADIGRTVESILATGSPLRPQRQHGPQTDRRAPAARRTVPASRPSADDDDSNNPPERKPVMTEYNMDLGGVVVATTLAFKRTLGAGRSGRRPRHVRRPRRWLVDNGCRCRAERLPRRVLVPDRRGAPRSSRSPSRPWPRRLGRRRPLRRLAPAAEWAENAAEDGADGVLLLPPTLYRRPRRDRRALRGGREGRAADHGLQQSRTTPRSTSPRRCSPAGGEGNIVAVKEFTGDVRRIFQISELSDSTSSSAPTTWRSKLVAGAVGWFAGYPNAFPRYASGCTTRSAVNSRRTPLYTPAGLAPLGSKTEFVQAIKLSMDIVGRAADPAGRPDPLDSEQEAVVTAATEHVVAALGSADHRPSEQDVNARHASSTRSTRTPRGCRPGRHRRRGRDPGRDDAERRLHFVEHLDHLRRC